MADKLTLWHWLGALLLFVGGLGLGYQAAASDAIWGASPGEPFELVAELDTVAAYPFEGKPDVRGVFEPGTEVRVRLWKGGVVYADVSTVLDEAQFLEAAGVAGR